MLFELEAFKRVYLERIAFQHPLEFLLYINFKVPSKLQTEIIDLVACLEDLRHLHLRRGLVVKAALYTHLVLLFVFCYDSCSLQVFCWSNVQFRIWLLGRCQHAKMTSAWLLFPDFAVQNTRILCQVCCCESVIIVNYRCLGRGRRGARVFFKLY